VYKQNNDKNFFGSLFNSTCSLPGNTVGRGTFVRWCTRPSSVKRRRVVVIVVAAFVRHALLSLFSGTAPITATLCLIVFDAAVVLLDGSADNSTVSTWVGDMGRC
jgi:hypothetical protein